MPEEFDAVIVGAGPAGATAAYHLARAGRRPLVIDKATFPREKVCGDGLTPRAVRCLEQMGVDTTGPSWARADGLRIIGAGVSLEMTWPEIQGMPRYGLSQTRHDFDMLLVEHARKAGAVVWEGTEVTGSILGADGAVTGVTIARDGERSEVHAPVTIAADGSSSRLLLGTGGRLLERRPMGVAVRTYFRSPRSTDRFFESYLELWHEGDLLPAYAWIFPLPDGTVNIGLGQLNTSKHFRSVDYRDLLWRFSTTLPGDWEIGPETQEGGKIRGGSLPMGINRSPVARPGLMVIGDAAGVVNPFNGEGIAYAMETAEIAAAVAELVLESGDPRSTRVYVERLREAYEGYYALGRIFSRLIGNATVMRTLTRYGLPRPRLMRFTFKLLGNLIDPRDGAAGDRLIDLLCRAALAAKGGAKVAA